MPETLAVQYTIPETVATVTGFPALAQKPLGEQINTLNHNMDFDDLNFLQNYFLSHEYSDPTIT